MKKFDPKQLVSKVPKIKKIKPLYLVPVALVLVLIVGGVLIFGGGGDGDGQDEGDAALGIGEGDPSRIPGQRGRGTKRSPVVRSGTLDEARRVGRLAVAQARGTIIEPSRIRIRVSAAPKQPVTVNYQLGCFKDRRAIVRRDQYRTRTPDIRAVELPTQGAKSCIVTAGAQLTDPDREGRVKVAVIAG